VGLNVTGFIVVGAWIVAAVLLFLDGPAWVFLSLTVGIGWLLGGIFRLLHRWAAERYPEEYARPTSS
jgi:ABC-type uncharacterized transport system permease subunit